MPNCHIDDIHEVEFKEFSGEGILTKELKEALLNKLKDYSQAKAYDPSVTYKEGQSIIHKEVVVIASKNNPGEPLEGNWELAPKFDVPCFNGLWCNGLARYLSLKIWIYSTDNGSVEHNGSGLIKKRGSDFTPLDPNEINHLTKKKYSKANNAYNMMKEYMEENPECFPHIRVSKSCGSRIDTQTKAPSSWGIY